MPNEEKALGKIRGKLAFMSTVTREMFQKAYKALVSHDSELGKEVIMRDTAADDLETELTELCLSFLALYAPKAQDLRYVVAVTRIATDMERIADHSTAMGRRVLTSHLSPMVASHASFREMVDVSESMLERATDSLFALKFENFDEFLRDLVRVKTLRTELERSLAENLGKDPESGLQTVHFLEVARRVSRISGHARNIMAMVPYVTKGELIRHKAENREVYDADTFN
ncbi:MAG: phosphate signaling complex protein PhoU [Deltaproteobacteria bacterium]|nr:phosphate signaling complex protein PhoU [Deltaproteobacteria bacterium]